MKAAIVEAPGQVVVREIAQPECGPYEACCDSLFGAICTGTDLHLVSGEFPWPIRYPAILGHETVGRVVRVGEKVRHLKVGDVVTHVRTCPQPESDLGICWGGFAQSTLALDRRAMQEDGLPEASWTEAANQEILPPDVDAAAGTMFITWRETWSYLTALGVGKGASILILGSGGNGLAFAAHAANRGAKMVALSGSLARKSTAMRAGVTHFYNYQDDWQPDAREILPDGFDCILDSVGKADQLDGVLPLLRDGGVLGIYGLDDHGRCHLTPSKARGTFTYRPPVNEISGSHQAVLEAYREGKLDAGLWLNLDAPFALDDIAAALEAVRSRQMVKALVQFPETKKRNDR